MNSMKTHIEAYLVHCELQKRLDAKTIKAYRTDLLQFSQITQALLPSEITPKVLESYIAHLNQTCKPKTAKRKIASAKTFFHYLEYKDIISRNPFSKIEIHLREPVILPKTIPLYTLEQLLQTIYRQHRSAKTAYQKKNALRDIAVTEMLFATGIRICELCSLTPSNVDLHDGIILIYGKGAKERRIQISNPDVLRILMEYRLTYALEIENANHFFVNQNGRPLSDQAVRRMLNKYTTLASIDLHITPHMFRHTFATSLLEADVDIRYIQNFLGHSSIHITEIYTHVTTAKQKDILSTKHPRKNFHFEE